MIAAIIILVAAFVLVALRIALDFGYDKPEQDDE